MVNYALPWSETMPILARYVISAKGYWESMLVTAHQATGSLLIALSTWLICRVGRRQSGLAQKSDSRTIHDPVSSLERLSDFEHSNSRPVSVG